MSSTKKPRLLRTQCSATSKSGALRATVIIPHPPREGVENKTLKAQLRAEFKPAVQRLADSMERVMADAVEEAING